jgi:hypothetical protein
VKELVSPHVLAHLSTHSQAVLTGRTFFPHLISSPFRSGLHTAFAFAIIACFVAAFASSLRGGSYAHSESPLAVESTGESASLGEPADTHALQA